MVNQGRQETGQKSVFAPMLPNWLAFLYAPILPLLKKITIRRAGGRNFNPNDILLPEGYTAELVASGFNAPVHCSFGPDGSCFVTESGHKIEAPPRILKVDVGSGAVEVVYTLPEERWNKTGSLTGACWVEDSLYFMNTDTLCRLCPEGTVEDIVTGLPGRGDHQSNYPVLGPDGMIYFGQGCATNSGVVGSDNFAYEWLPKFPDFCDVPAQDIRLVGRNFDDRDVLHDVTRKIKTGAYVPFGTNTIPGQIIPGSVRCTGSILRCNANGSGLEVVAWGLRNPFGVAFGTDGKLYATEHGMDERSQRYIFDDPDDFYEIEPGRWYGWPDFASGIRMDDPYWGEGGRGREPVLAEFPEPEPPRPMVSFQTHAAANGVDFCRAAEFGFEGDAFVALFGDLAPVTTVKRAAAPAGFKVVRINLAARQIVDFAVNRIAGPASMLPHSGFERPSHVQFGPDGALYVVDYGIIKIAPERGGIRMQEGSGALWRIRRKQGPYGFVAHGAAPPAPLELPVYLLRYLIILLAVVLAFFGIKKLIKKVRIS